MAHQDQLDCQTKADETTPLIATRYLPRVQVVEALVILCCAVDAADKTVLPSVFLALEKDLKASPAQLGTLNFCQSIAMSLALPLWGAAASYWSMRSLLVLGCCMWGCATTMLAFSLDFRVHCMLRVINGIGLCGVLPVSQALLVNTVPEDQRGAAFGRLGGICAITGMLTQWYAVSTQEDDGHFGLLSLHGWQIVHLQIGCATFACAALVFHYMPQDCRKQADSADKQTPLMDILRIPSFVLLVLQGVVGSVPWNAMAFLSLYWTSVGFSAHQAGRLMLFGGFGGVLGNFASGYLGDAAARRFPDRGRVCVAFTSVVFGGPLFIIAVLLADTASYVHIAVLYFCFHLVACWTPAAANRPICAELVSSPEDRARIVAWWVMLEGTSASIFGAPLVGLLSEKFGYRLDPHTGAADNVDSAALAWPIVGISAICWALCAVFYIVMGVTLPYDRNRAASQSYKVT